MEDAGTADAYISRIEAARKQGRRIQILMALVIVGVFGYFSWQIYNTFADFNDEAFMRKLNKRAAADVWPAVVSELDRVVSAATPVLAEKFASQLEADWPAIGKAIDDETAALAVKLRAHPEKVVTAFSKAMAEPIRSMLKERFPDLAEEALKRLTTRIQSRMGAWAQSRLTEGVEMHVEAMLEIKRSLDAFKPKTDGKGKGTMSPDDFLIVLLEVIDIRLAGPVSTEAPATPGGAK